MINDLPVTNYDYYHYNTLVSCYKYYNILSYKFYFQIPFTTFSTLNAVITFADVQNVQFKVIHTDKHSFIWHAIGDRYSLLFKCMI